VDWHLCLQHHHRPAVQELRRSQEC
jgi:hypothetical protein